MKKLLTDVLDWLEDKRMLPVPNRVAVSLATAWILPIAFAIFGFYVVLSSLLDALILSDTWLIVRGLLASFGGMVLLAMTLVVAQEVFIRDLRLRFGKTKNKEKGARSA